MKPRSSSSSSNKSFKCIFTILVLKEKQQRQTLWGFQRCHQGSLWLGCKTMSWFSTEMRPKWPESQNPRIYWTKFPSYTCTLVEWCPHSPWELILLHQLHWSAMPIESIKKSVGWWPFILGIYFLAPTTHKGPAPWLALVYIYLLVFLRGPLCSGHYAWCLRRTKEHLKQKDIWLASSQASQM